MSQFSASSAAASGYAPFIRLPQGVQFDAVDPWLEINTSNLAWNLSQVRQRTGDRPIMAVVKCNAYGHGTVGIAQLLQEQGVRHFAVVKMEEAVALRDSGVTGAILNFGPINPRAAAQTVQYDISQSVFSDAVDLLAAAAQKLDRQARVHIKIDTGLNRVGVSYQHALPFMRKVAAMPQIHIEGIFTTLAEDADFDPVQVERLRRVCRQAQQEGIHTGIRHAASSSAISVLSAPLLDMVRPGNCLYGFEPLPHLDLRPVMSLKSRVMLIKTLQPGETIAYHRQRTVEKEMRLATVPVGYADGYPFQAVNQGQVLIRGRRFPLIVYMSANHAFVDVTGADDIEAGDEVLFFGAQAGSTLPLHEVAAWANSTVYKLASAMSPFLPRVYLV